MSRLLFLKDCDYATRSLWIALPWLVLVATSHNLYQHHNINPIAITEILSDSTEKYDRGDKFRMYRSISSFQEYFLVSRKAMQLEKFTKKEHNQ
ncbi:MAG: Uma2 family endonuclease [Waterburya sp.]